MVVCLLTLLLLLGVGLGDVHSSPAEPGDTSLLQRLERLESQVQEQDTQLRLQGHKLLQQEQKLTHQTQKISSLESLLHRQNDRLSRQDKQLRWHRSKLSRQDELLSQCESKLSSADMMHCEQIDSLCKEMAQSHPQDNFKEDESDSSVEAEYGNRSPSKDVTLNLGAIMHPSLTDQASTHDAKARAEDAGPLEAVVGRLSQQVTEMSADIQAWKTQTDTDIQTLQTSNLRQDHDIQDAATSTFVHWGSSQCANASQLVYSGVVGGSSFDYTGSASNYLCLTMSPVFSSHPNPLGFFALLYGGEYHTQDSHHDKDAVCAVCRSTYSTTIMIPGTNVCTAGWQLQYSGYLMAGAYDQVSSTEYICVDSRLENSVRGDQAENAQLLYFTLTRCGSLPCSPYVNDKLVTCAVCSK